MGLIRPDDKILFQGDSITDAFRKPEEAGVSYRMGAGWAMIVAARLLAERPHDGLQFENRGVSGNDLGSLEARWEADCLALGPTVLSLLVGVNGVLGNHDARNSGLRHTQFEQQYRALLITTRRRLPDIRLILCEPFLLPFPGRANAGPAGKFTLQPVTDVQLGELRPRQAVVRRLAAEFSAVFVPLQERLEQAAASTGAEHWLVDGIHPNAAGQWLLANAWVEEVERA